MNIVDKQIDRVREEMKDKVSSDTLNEIFECLISPYQCKKCGLRGDTLTCPDCDPETNKVKCAHLCTHCGNIFSHDIFTCARGELLLCERCQGFENSLMWDRLRKEVGIKIAPDKYNFMENERERCLSKLITEQMSMEELEKHIFAIEEEIAKLRAISGGARSARIRKMQDDEEQGKKTDRDLFLVYEQDKANKNDAKKREKEVTIAETMYEKTFATFKKMGLSDAQCEKFTDQALAGKKK